MTNYKVENNVFELSLGLPRMDKLEMRFAILHNFNSRKNSIIF